MKPAARILASVGFAALAAVLCFNSQLWIQALMASLAWTMWLIFEPLIRRGALAAMMACSVGPFMVSASFVDEIWPGNQALYHIVTCSPVYLWLRLWTQPWTSQAIYQDSPFHLSWEPSSVPLLISILAAMSVYSIGRVLLVFVIKNETMASELKRS